MSYLLHSSIVNPAKPTLKVKENVDSVDKITMDVPLLTRILELAREDIKSDEELHNLLTRIIELKNQDVLTMNDYDKITQTEEQPEVGAQPEPEASEPKNLELEAIMKLAGIR